MNITKNETSYSQYHFLNCVFHSNEKKCNTDVKEASYSGLTTGAGISLPIQSHVQRTRTFIENCTFVNNTALWGGGTGADPGFCKGGVSIIHINVKFIKINDINIT